MHRGITKGCNFILDSLRPSPLSFPHVVYDVKIIPQWKTRWRVFSVEWDCQIKLSITYLFLVGETNLHPWCLGKPYGKYMLSEREISRALPWFHMVRDKAEMSCFVYACEENSRKQVCPLNLWILGINSPSLKCVATGTLPRGWQ